MDSCVLLADLAEDAKVSPLYIKKGLAWEGAELAALVTFIGALANPNIGPVTTLKLPVKDIYGKHWSVSGKGAPEYDAPASAVYLPGRNVLLIGLSAVWCSTHKVHRIAIGSLGGNPFPDATPTFFESFTASLSQGLSHRITLEAPYRGMTKAELIKTHSHLPLELSLTCMAPTNGGHCGDCNKCRERQEAFAEASVQDHTSYAKRQEQ
ncbi:MAG: 7-cyano-7-deazaguanine synthase [Chloroflexi bacterium]|nr:7-cyano-7-deazaguanine synthase [Chloroflexota bacterium]